MKNKIYSDWFNQYPWEWFVTLTFPDYPRFSEDKVDKLRLDWTRALCVTERIQVGYMYALVYKDGHPHLHLLMIGGNKTGRGLSDVDKSLWKKKWRWNAKIELPESNLAVSNYLDKNKSAPDGDYDFSKLKFLDKFRDSWVDNFTSSNGRDTAQVKRYRLYALKYLNRGRGVSNKALQNTH
jgi:hypothetical protein